MINPTLSHAERVRLGLTPADPNFMPTPIYNPDTKINAEQRKKNAEAARGRANEVFADKLNTFSAWELEELRLDMLKLGTLRAQRFVSLIEAHEAAADYLSHVKGTIDGAALDDLEESVTGVEDQLTFELQKAKDDEINELLEDNPQASPAELCTAFRLWHAAERERLRKEVVDQLQTIREAVETTKKALEAIDPLS